MGAKRDFLVLAGLAAPAVHALYTACASERNWSAWASCAPSTALKARMELIYVRCNSMQFILRRMIWKLACSCMRR
eukprot:485156-Pelagomonas_calceolata.AAC.2